MLNSLEKYILIFFTYSFLGWCMESFGNFLKEKRFINRGFLIGPYCPVYGTGVVLITLLLKKYTNDILVLFLLSTLICGILEYITSYMMEKFFNARWWDYTKRKFNINGRVCLETLIPFGIVGTIIICIINPFFIGIYNNLPDFILKLIAYGLVCIYTIDMIISLKIILSFKKEIYKKQDNTEEISNMVKDKAEDMLMKAESDAIVFSRKMKVRSLKLQRKIAHYTREELSEDFNKDLKELAAKLAKRRANVNEKLQLGKEKIDTRIREAKANIEEKQKVSKENLENAIQNIKMSSEEFTKQVKERFKKESILKSRLIDAFPDLKIRNEEKNNKK